MTLLFGNRRYANIVVRLFRIARLVIHTFYGLFIASTILRHAKPRHREAIIRRWAQCLLQIMNIRLSTAGHVPNRDIAGVLFVANHISWIDIHALNSIRTVRFISKAEVRHWPIFGRLAANANTLFIDRTKKQDAARIVEVAAESIKAGDCLCYFPEGTTTDGTELKVFKGSLMQSAINAECIVWPFTVRYPNPDGTVNTEMAYWGDITLFESIWMIISQKKTAVTLEFLSPIQAKGHDRRSLTLAARQQIAANLGLNQTA